MLNSIVAEVPANEMKVYFMRERKSEGVRQVMNIKDNILLVSLIIAIKGQGIKHF